MSILHISAIVLLVVVLVVLSFLFFHYETKKERAEKDLEIIRKEKFIYGSNPEATLMVADIERRCSEVENRQSYCRLGLITGALLLALLVFG